MALAASPTVARAGFAGGKDANFGIRNRAYYAKLTDVLVLRRAYRVLRELHRWRDFGGLGGSWVCLLKLFVPQRFDRVHIGGAIGRI